MRDLRRTGRVSGWHQSKQTYKRERKANDALSVDGRLCSTRSAVKTRATEESATEVGRGRQPAKEDWREKGDQMSKGGEVEQFHE